MRHLARLLGAAAVVACSEKAPGAAARPLADSTQPADTPRVALLGQVSGPLTVQSTVRTTPTLRADAALVAAVAVARALMPPDAGPPMPLAPEARGVCDSLTAVWESVPGAVVRRGDTLVRPGDALGDSVLAQWGDRPTGPAVAACFVKGEAEAGVDSTVRERLSWTVPGAWRGKNGWSILERMAASGPDGGEMHYQRGLTRCRVYRQWDPGDAGDSTYVPSPYYLERIVCWTHWRPIMPPDTAQGPG